MCTLGGQVQGFYNQGSFLKMTTSMHVCALHVQGVSTRKHANYRPTFQCIALS